MASSRQAVRDARICETCLLDHHTGWMKCMRDPIKIMFIPYDEFDISRTHIIRLILLGNTWEECVRNKIVISLKNANISI